MGLNQCRVRYYAHHDIRFYQPYFTGPTKEHKTVNIRVTSADANAVPHSCRRLTQALFWVSYWLYVHTACIFLCKNLFFYFLQFTPDHFTFSFFLSLLRSNILLFRHTYNCCGVALRNYTKKYKIQYILIYFINMFIWIVTFLLRMYINLKIILI